MGAGGLDVINFQLTFIAAQTLIEATQVLPPLLSSHQGNRQTLHTGWWLLNTAPLVVTAKELEVVTVWFCPSEKVRARQRQACFLRW